MHRLSSCTHSPLSEDGRLECSNNGSEASLLYKTRSFYMKKILQKFCFYVWPIKTLASKCVGQINFDHHKRAREESLAIHHIKALLSCHLAFPRLPLCFAGLRCGTLQWICLTLFCLFSAPFITLSPLPYFVILPIFESQYCYTILRVMMILSSPNPNRVKTLAKEWLVYTCNS